LNAIALYAHAGSDGVLAVPTTEREKVNQQRTPANRGLQLIGLGFLMCISGLLVITLIGAPFGLLLFAFCVRKLVKG
jgi:hypothetical protein